MNGRRRETGWCGRQEASNTLPYPPPRQRVPPTDGMPPNQSAFGL